jgi:hypothetical protein
MNMIKKVLLSALLGVSVVVPANAAYFEQTALIDTVSTSAPDLWGDWEYILLDGWTSAGSCLRESPNGLVLVRLTHSKAFAAALAAQAAGRRVTVSIDDTRTDSQGHCLLRWMKVVD